MGKILTSIIVIIFTFSPFMAGCGEDELKESPARILETDPQDGGEMFSNGQLVITFDKPVVIVKVNGSPAGIAGAEATWRATALEAGKQTLRIEWTDGNGNSDSQDITLTINEVDVIICFQVKGEEHESRLHADGTAQGQQRPSRPLV